MSVEALQLSFVENEDAPEPSAPSTQLVERPKKAVRAQPELKIGAYTIVERIVLAPGAYLVEARGQSDERAILQLVRCREVKSEAEETERRYFEKRIADATNALAGEADIELHAHGAIDSPDGKRTLFWALPWIDGVHALADPQPKIRDLLHFVDIALSLAKRIASRHARERAEPLLTEHLIHIHPDRSSAELVGASIFVAHEWLSSDMLAARLAPEEILSRTVTPLGDLWRLGQALTSLAAGRADLCAPKLTALLARLLEGDPTRRFPRATEVIVEL